MKRLRVFLLPVVLAAGCAGQPPRDPLLEEAQARLQAALREGSEQEAAEARQQFARLVRERSRQLVEEKRPGEALRLLEAGLKEAPDDAGLREALERLRQQKRTVLETASLKRDLAEATWLELRLRHDRLLRQWGEAGPIDAVGTPLRARRLDALLVSLRARAADAVRARDRATAEEILSLLERLRGKSFVEAEREAFDRAWPPRQAEAVPKKPRPRHSARRPSRPRHKRQATIPSLRRTLARALQEGDLQNSLRLAREIASKKPDDPAIDDLVRAIEAAIQARIAHLDELAGLAYRDQNYPAAAALWEQILRIDPDNADAKVRLERVQKVIANLEALQQGEPKQQMPGAADAGKSAVTNSACPSGSGCENPAPGAKTTATPPR